MELAKRIVIIDDDPICHFIGKRIIEKFSSLDVEAFTQSEEALKELTLRALQQPDIFPDYILLDINMPLMDGWQFLEEFKKLPDQVIQKSSIIILSSSILPSDVEKSRRYGVKKFFSKPLSKDTLKQIILLCN